MKRVGAFILAFLYVAYIAVALFCAGHEERSCADALTASAIGNFGNEAADHDTHISSCLFSEVDHHLPTVNSSKVPAVSTAILAKERTTTASAANLSILHPAIDGHILSQSPIYVRNCVFRL